MYLNKSGTLTQILPAQIRSNSNAQVFFFFLVFPEYVKKESLPKRES